MTCECHSLTFLSGFSVLFVSYDLFLGANKHGWMDGSLFKFNSIGEQPGVSLTYLKRGKKLVGSGWLLIC